MCLRYLAAVLTQSSKYMMRVLAMIKEEQIYMFTNTNVLNKVEYYGHHCCNEKYECIRSPKNTIQNV